MTDPFVTEHNRIQSYVYLQMALHRVPIYDWHIFNLLYQVKHYSYTLVPHAILMKNYESFTYPKDAHCEIQS
jgi:hypothetical protein